MGEIRSFSSHVRWSQTEIDAIHLLYPSASSSDLLSALPGRSRSQIQNKANGLGVNRIKKPKMTTDELRESKRKHMANRRASNPSAVREYQLKQHYKNHEQSKATMRAYAKKRFFWNREMHLRGEGRATAKQLSALWRKQKGRCALTGRRLDRTANLDHRLPKAKGGKDNIENLQWLCEEANMAKRHMTDEQFTVLCCDVMRFIGSRINAAVNAEKLLKKESA